MQARNMISGGGPQRAVRQPHTEVTPMKRWYPIAELSKKEQLIIKRLKRTRKLFAFLRLQRQELFDDAFQDELERMYQWTGAGEEPVPPALLCMALILQAYHRISDAEAVELTIMDLRWQMVLGCVGADEPAFAQATLQTFRERLIRTNMDRRLLERTIEMARKTKEFDWMKLPKALHVAIDSRPFEGAGRVEDTFNLLGHAARKIVECAADLAGMSREEVCREAGIPLLLAPSIKAGLDINWNDPEQKDQAIDLLASQVTSLNEWLERGRLATQEPLRPYIEAVAQVRKQDLEVATDGRVHIRRGVAEDRRVSIEDAEMRHGRKSKTKRFNGYKQHVAVDLDSNLILACAVTPANRPEEEAIPAIRADLDRCDVRIGTLSVDRAYINSQLVEDVLAQSGTVLAKPWSGRNSRPELFGKRDFKFDMRAKTIVCPAGQIEAFEPGQVVEFDPEVCGPCAMRSLCTMSASGKGRQVQIAKDEAIQQKFRKLQGSPAGRERLRARTGVEHSLAHIAARQGPKARYRGTHKNVFDLRRTAAVENLETIRRVHDRAAKAAAQRQI
jgi:hypothetical protein